jgi:hypothetical protein
MPLLVEPCSLTAVKAAERLRIPVRPTGLLLTTPTAQQLLSSSKAGNA